MCPLRLILIFLSAALAGFFVLRNVKSRPFSSVDGGNDTNAINKSINDNSSPQLSDSSSGSRFSKVRTGVVLGFWTFVDMASGKYLWRQLGSASKS